jgi:hypothetical protein
MTFLILIVLSLREENGDVIWMNTDAFPSDSYYFVTTKEACETNYKNEAAPHVLN